MKTHVNTKDVNRFEIIDHSPCRYCLGTGRNNDEECTGCEGRGCPGRTVIVWDDRKKIDAELQDDGRTLKVFIHERYEE